MRKILVANDDGIDSEGLARLAALAKKFGEVWVVAPHPKIEEPIARRAKAPAPVAKTSGTNPIKEENAVIIMARKRICAPFLAASRTGIPCSC